MDEGLWGPEVHRAVPAALGTTGGPQILKQEARNGRITCRTGPAGSATILGENCLPFSKDLCMDYEKAGLHFFPSLSTENLQAFWPKEVAYHMLKIWKIIQLVQNHLFKKKKSQKYLLECLFEMELLDHPRTHIRCHTRPRSFLSLEDMEQKAVRRKRRSFCARLATFRRYFPSKTTVPYVHFIPPYL